MSDASYTQVTGKLDCNKCVWGTRDGGCASWECEFIDRNDAVKAWRNMPSAQSEIIRCKDCKHKPHTSDKYDYDNGDCGFEIIFPDYRCPCRCEDEYYNCIPDDDWYCGNAEKR